MCICLAAASTAMINSCALLCFPTQISAVHCYTNHSVSAEAQLQKEVLQEKARATGLEVQIRALCLELAHARENAGICWHYRYSYAPMPQSVMLCGKIAVQRCMLMTDHPCMF